MKKNVPASKPVKKTTALVKKGFSVSPWLVLIIICIITIISFLPTLANMFTNWDDENYVIKDGLIRSLSIDNIIRIFKTKEVMGNYHPLAILSLAVDYNFFSLDSPEGYHAVSLFLHILSTCFVFVFIQRLFKKPVVTYVSTLLFAIHPMRVESVAWVSERKDQLYVLFYIAGLLTYLLYIDKKKVLYFIVTVVLFVMSVLSKGQAVTFPLALIIIDYLRKEKITAVNVVLKVILLCFSAYMGIVAIHAQKASDSINDIISHNTTERLLFACYALMGYLSKLVVPLNLSTFYPYPEKVNGSYEAWVYISILSPFALGAMVWLCRKRPVIISGVAFFMLNIILLLQLLPVGNAVMADRYSYLAYLGLFWTIGFGIDYLLNTYRQWTLLLLAAAFGYAAFLSYTCYNRTLVWHDSEALWKDVIEQFPRVPVAQNNLGSFYQKALDTPNSLPSDLQNAKIHFDQAIKLQANYKEARTNRSDIFRRMGKADSAIIDADIALRLDPNYAEAHQNRGIAYAIANKPDSALYDFNWLIALNKNNADAYANRGNLNDMMSRIDSALSDYNNCIRLNPTKYDAYGNRAHAWVRKGDFNKAIQDANIGLQYFPNNIGFLATRAQAYYSLGQWNNALNDYIKLKATGTKLYDPLIEELKQRAGIK